STPLATADLLAGIELRLRSDVLLAAAGGQPMQVGGQAEGFFVDVRVPFRVGPLLITAGLAYLQQMSYRREHFTGLTIPLAVAIGIGHWLSAQLELQANTFMVKEWVSPDRHDPHFYSPLSLAVTGYLGPRLFVEARALHYLGVGDREPIDVQGVIGARL